MPKEPINNLHDFVKSLTEEQKDFLLEFILCS